MNERSILPNAQFDAMQGNMARFLDAVITASANGADENPQLGCRGTAE